MSPQPAEMRAEMSHPVIMRYFSISHTHTHTSKFSRFLNLLLYLSAGGAGFVPTGSKKIGVASAFQSQCRGVAFEARVAFVPDGP